MILSSQTFVVPRSSPTFVRIFHHLLPRGDDFLEVFRRDAVREFYVVVKAVLDEPTDKGCTQMRIRVQSARFKSKP